jgi:hypothetical protein
MIEQEPNVIAVLEELLPYELDMLEGCFFTVARPGIFGTTKRKKRWKLEDFTDRMPPAGVEKVGVDWRGRS